MCCRKALLLGFCLQCFAVIAVDAPKPQKRRRNNNDDNVMMMTETAVLTKTNTMMKMMGMMLTNK